MGARIERVVGPSTVGRERLEVAVTETPLQEGMVLVEKVSLPENCHQGNFP